MGTPSAVHRRRLRHLALPLALAVPLACFDGGRAQEHWYQVIVNPAEQYSLVVRDGVRVDIDNALDVEASFGTAAPNLVTVNGHALRIGDGHLRLGERDYGALQSTSLARIDAAGVTIDGVLRGALP